MDAYNYIFSFIEGILTFVSPCMLPLLPLYLFYILGTSNTGTSNSNDSGKRRMVKNALGFVLGFTIIFVLLGAVATSVGYFLRNHIDIFRKISGIIMIVFGLYFLGILNIRFLNREVKLKLNVKVTGFFSSILFGMIFAFGWSPCSGPFLGSALLMAGNRETVLEGMLLLLSYSAGLGIPFLIVSILYKKVEESFNALKKYNKVIRIVSGVILILAGILVYTNVLGGTQI